jgi:hypothetical protein
MIRKGVAMRLGFLIILIGLTAVTSVIAIDTITLLTFEEAVMPEAPRQPFDVSRTINFGPDIKVVAPELNREYKVPVRIVVNFIPREGKSVDISKFKIECLKLFPIDITNRIKPYTSEKGIDMDNASLPAGQYKFRLTIGDAAGGITQEVFNVKVVE